MAELSSKLDVMGSSPIPATPASGVVNSYFSQTWSLITKQHCLRLFPGGDVVPQIHQLVRTRKPKGARVAGSSPALWPILSAMCRKGNVTGL